MNCAADSPGAAPAATICSATWLTVLPRRYSPFVLT
jgi:hypothetical protein